MADEKKLSISCRNVIICDDVRREDNGKTILIGIYTGDVVIANYPSISNAKFWFEIASEGDGKESFSARAVLEPGGRELFNVTAEIERERGPNGEEVTEDYFAASSPPVPIEESGRIDVQFRAGDDEWQTIRSKRVISMAELSGEAHVGTKQN